MKIILCDICSKKVDYVSTNNGEVEARFLQKTGSSAGGIRFSFPVFEGDKKFCFIMVDVCLSCGQDLFTALATLKAASKKLASKA